jgi:predicted Ser/Thr protein kinase
MDEANPRESQPPTELPHGEGRIDRVADTKTFEGSATDRFASQPPATTWNGPPAGSRLGEFELLQRLGAGGMGVVYRARQRGVDRMVALKLIRPDRLEELAPQARAETLRRFLTEARAAAQLEHDHIVTVYDVGEVEGQPFYSMRYIEGSSLADMSADGPLDNRRAASCLEPVARAMQYAHGRGILHRDLKPRNIMVDQAGRAYVTDFGLAKLLDEGDSGLTRTGQAFGTPPYMSPEQAQDASRATAASDIYSLGATLYDLLTGRPPFRAATPVETLRQVIEQEPVAPRLLSASIERDLETITLKCLAKDPQRRYHSAGDLADDLNRWLKGEPIHARPVGSLERSWRWSRRHPAAAFAVAAVLIGLVTASGLSAALFRANQDLTTVNDDLRRANLRETQAKNDAEHEKENAKQSAAEALAVLEFFKTKVLAAARQKDQEGGLGHDATIRAALDAAEPQIASAFRDQPFAEAQIRDTLGSTYFYLGEGTLATAQYERSQQLLAEKFGPSDPKVLTSANNLAAAYRAAGQFEKAIPHFERTLERQSSTLGPDHPDTLRTTQNLAELLAKVGRLDQSLSLTKQVLEKRRAKLGDDHADTLASMNNLAAAYQNAGQLALALPLYEETLQKWKAKYGGEHPSTITGMNNLGACLWSMRNFKQAEDIFAELVPLSRRVNGPDHPETLKAMYNLAAQYDAQSKYDLAIPIYVDTLNIRRERLGPDHPDTIASMNNLATAYRRTGQLDLAWPVYEEALERSKANRGAEHSQTLGVMNNLALAYLEADRPNLAEPLLVDAVAGLRRTIGAAHPNTQSCLRALADCYRKLKQPEKGEPLLRELVDFWHEKAGPESRQYGTELGLLGRNLLAQGNPASAEPILRESLRIREPIEPDNWGVYYVKSLLGQCLADQKNFTEAETVLLAGYEGMKRRIPPQFKSMLTEARQRLVELYDAWGQPDDADRWRSEGE